MNFSDYTPMQILKELDKYVIGQGEAKRSVAIALRNRWRRKRVEQPMRDEIAPHNILMVGPTGVGKTEIARRLAKLVDAPFIKLEATKFTEVGYVGRDVDSIIRDLLDNAVHMIRQKHRDLHHEAAVLTAGKIIIETLVGETASIETKEKYYKKFKEGKLDDREIEIEISDSTSTSGMADIPGMPGSQIGVLNMSDILSKISPPKMKKVKLPIQEAYEELIKSEVDKLIDEDKVIMEAKKSVEEDAIVFLDEIDKLIASNKGQDVNKEGVQRELLPLIEGTIINTKYGPINTDHILFIASGAFHLSKPSDLLPELQGRLPIRVELSPLSENDLMRILKELKFSLIKQLEALFATENVKLEFKDSAIKKIAKIASEINLEVENIGARRLHTIIEKCFEALSFTADEVAGTTVVIDAKYIENHLGDITKSHDLKNFIL